MKKTLYIQIDNNPLPDGCCEDVEVLDCRCINDFCSMVGDALVSDLKDENGKPFYRLINPVGRLLSEYEEVDKTNYDLIIAQWLDVLGELLHKGVTKSKEQFAISFPQQYTDWLLCNEIDYYVEIGKHLQSNDDKVFLDANGISEDIISALHMKIHRFLEQRNGEFKYIVLSNPCISNSSLLVNKLKDVFKQFYFLKYAQWIKVLEEIKLEKAEEYFNVNGVEFRMILVQGGTFTMGATSEQLDRAQPDEKPAHEVTLSTFRICDTLVTQELWETVMGNNPSFYKGKTFPVSHVSWTDCQNFILKLNSITGKTFRLPTEAEWEFAARGGINSKGYKFSGSDNLDEVAWYFGNMTQIEPHPVATKAPNELGLYDMSGSVMEWCQDFMRTYNTIPQVNPVGLKSNPNESVRIATRGGDDINDESYCRVSARCGDYAWDASGRLGFRLAL